MRRSPIAHIIAVPVALALTLLSLILLTLAGIDLWTGVMRYQVTLDHTLPALGLQAVGVVLLVAVAFTGLFSSVGLMSTASIGLAAAILVSTPALMLAAVGSGGFLPFSAAHLLVGGTPQIVGTVLAAGGVAAALRRRSPRRAAVGGHLVALLGTPILIGTGLWVALWGLETVSRTVVTLDPSPADPLAIAAHVFGLLLIGFGILLANRSPLALLLPAVATGTIATLSILPGALPAVFFRMQSAAAFLVTGGGATAMTLLALVGVLLITGALAGRARQRTAAPQQPRHPAFAPPGPPTAPA